MKKLLKPFTLLLAGLLMAGSMVACGGDADGDSDKLLTPEDVYKKVDKAEDIKMIMEMEITDMMTTTMTAEKDGDKAYTITEMEMMGMTQTVEGYTEKKGDTLPQLFSALICPNIYKRAVKVKNKVHIYLENRICRYILQSSQGNCQEIFKKTDRKKGTSLTLGLSYNVFNYFTSCQTATGLLA